MTTGNLPSLLSLTALDRASLRRRISGHAEPQRRELDDDARYELECERVARERSAAAWEATLAALPPAERSRRKAAARQIGSTLTFLSSVLPTIQKREELRQCVLAAVADHSTRPPPAALMRTVTTKRSAAYAAFDLGAGTAAIASVLGLTEGHAKNYRSGWYTVRSERIALRLQADVPADDELGLQWWINETLAALHTARDDIGHLVLAVRALALLGEGFEV